MMDPGVILLSRLKEWNLMAKYQPHKQIFIPVPSQGTA